jgi:cytochrome c
MRRIVVLGAAALALIFLSILPSAAEPAAEGEAPALDGAALYQQRTCIACHGQDAKTPILPEYPKLAGQNADYMLQQMKDIKSGARNNGNTAAMSGVMHLVDESEMGILSEYLSGLEP